MPISRTYRCSDCEHEFTVLHLDREERETECPKCPSNVTQMPGRFSIGTNKGKAVDYAYKMAEQDYGLTDMRDNQRAGDTAAMGPAPMQTAEREKAQQQIAEMVRQSSADGVTVAPEVMSMVENQGGFWAGGLANQVSPGAVAPAKAPGQQDNVGILEAGRDRGISTKMKYDVVARTDMKT